MEASLNNLDISNKLLRSALRNLSPFFLRLGGSLCDFVRYIPKTDPSCANFSSPTNATRIGYKLQSGCFGMDRWKQLLELCSDSGCNVVFGINALLGRKKVQCPPGTNCRFDSAKNPCCTAWSGQWDASETERFLRVTRAFEKESGSTLRAWGFEYGNELAGRGGIEVQLPVDTYVAGFCQLHELVRKIWNDGNVPKIIAPDSAFDAEWFEEFVEKSSAKGCAPDIVTWHQYLLGAGVDPKVGTKAMDPAYLDKQKADGDAVKVSIENGARAYGKAPSIWMGEAGGAYNSGAHGMSDRFHSSFWYLDSLGVLAQRGHQTFCRQTLVGGNYGLLHKATFEPNPDSMRLLCGKN